ncbi:FKBP-type peptidyl-prolyl cis-trans isomerase FklB [Oceanospirillum multiglobuliferum]|uniref:Peptidyl-prolyl cis-trans isomerase n=1 Tax=Oceanospirillum multiglobuliferum TaxID=64969 RepID=A0A1T4SLV0_9GAMM|nr:FKBP-type peptidyl-prolyl cis-trans isomerase [Oceanospirillum multiglobuliferum]OPX54165.1 peptidylprolyl isomerase [Oceanospirillum multiglobuliferum]SKA29155.1 FKBP-type peptidyl-prolyl cis-trans isomerase FklB [Oceanospirillum multiglobuliferum]
MSELATVEAKVSYGIGRQMGEQLASSGIDGLLLDQVALGLREAFEGAESRVSDMELHEAFEVIQQRLAEKQKAQHQNTIDAANAYLADNAKKEGVVVTASGLQYEVLTVGTGAIPSATDKVRVHYHGELINGEVFDSSVERGQPAEFPVGGVIRGWVEALQLMPVGSKWLLTIPAELAYGERGAGAIPPYSALVFEVELLDIISAQ